MLLISPLPSFHSCVGRNLILATARIFREAEHCNCRLSANAASPQRFLPTQEWKRGQEWKSEAGMRDIADCLTPRRLRGGVKIRASEFLGGGGMPPIIVISPPPATASRSHPPPQAAEGKNSFLSKKEFPFPRKRESPQPLIVFRHRIPKTVR